MWVFRRDLCCHVRGAGRSDCGCTKPETCRTGYFQGGTRVPGKQKRGGRALSAKETAWAKVQKDKRANAAASESSTSPEWVWVCL